MASVTNLNKPLYLYRLLESDSRYTQRIDRTESNASMSKERSESILSTFSEIPPTIVESEQSFSSVQEPSLPSLSSDETSLVPDSCETQQTTLIIKESELLRLIIINCSYPKTLW